MKIRQFALHAAMLAVLALTAFAGSSLIAPSAEARVFVGIHAPVAPPPPHREYRPGRPYAGAVWIPGYWRWAHRRHVWVGGYWAKPPRHYHNWVPGHWRSTPRGWIWIDGHWR